MTPSEKRALAKQIGFTLAYDANGNKPTNREEARLIRRENEAKLRALPEPSRSAMWSSYLHLIERMTGQDYDELVKRFPNFTTFDENGNDFVSGGEGLRS